MNDKTCKTCIMEDECQSDKEFACDNHCTLEQCTEIGKLIWQGCTCTEHGKCDYCNLGVRK